jgi:hypothetical protein
MDGEPDRWLLRLRPLNAVTFPCGNEDVIPCAQRPRGRLVFELQFGVTLEHDHPLVPRLIIPEARRTSLPLRYNALDLQSRPGEYFAERFFPYAGGRNIRNVRDRLPARTVIDIPTLFPAPNYLQSARSIAIKVITLKTTRTSRPNANLHRFRSVRRGLAKPCR